MSDITTVCGIIGDPIKHSFSPKMHNAAYKELGINYCYLPFHVQKSQLGEAIKGMRVLNIRGLAVTIPHKQAVIPFLDEITPLAATIGAVNTIVNNNGVLKGYNTDASGFLTALTEVTNLKNKKIALIGAGGGARAIAFILKTEDCLVHIYNRTLEKAIKLAQECQAESSSLETIQLFDPDIIINATSVGMSPNDQAIPIHSEILNSKMVVFDTIYNPKNTHLIKSAKRAGAKVIYGYKMLLYQGLQQFELFTNHKAPQQIMEKTIDEL